MKFGMLLLASSLLIGGCSSSQVENTTKSASGALGDAAITAQITTRLIAIDGDSALHVAVASNDGAVTLSGRAKSAAIAERFSAAAKSVSGVKSVASRVVVDFEADSGDGASERCRDRNRGDGGAHRASRRQRAEREGPRAQWRRDTRRKREDGGAQIDDRRCRQTRPRREERSRQPGSQVVGPRPTSPC